MAKIRRNLGIPAGVVFQSAATTAPHGYLLCDGSEVLKSDYPELYASIGDNYGTASDPLKFCLPDYRGRFLRGIDPTATIDADAASRTALKPGAVAGNAVGSEQTDAIRNMTGYFAHTDDGATDMRVRVKETSGIFTSQTITENYLNSSGVPGAAARPGRVLFDASRVVPTGGDNRPKNVAVNYIIKY